jgi:hypothetical protein
LLGPKPFCWAKPTYFWLQSILICRDHILNTGEDAVRISCLHEKAKIELCSLTINIIIFVANIRCGGCTVSSIWALGNCTPRLSNFKRHGVPLCRCNTHYFRAWWHHVHQVIHLGLVICMNKSDATLLCPYIICQIPANFMHSESYWIENPKGSRKSQKQSSCKAINNSCLLRSLLEFGKSIGLHLDYRTLATY